MKVAVIQQFALSFDVSLFIGTEEHALVNDHRAASAICQAVDNMLQEQDRGRTRLIGNPNMALVQQTLRTLEKLSPLR